MILFPFVSRAYAAQLEAENRELRRRLSAGGHAAQRNARSLKAATLERLRAEIKQTEMSQ